MRPCNVALEPSEEGVNCFESGPGIHFDFRFSSEAGVSRTSSFRLFLWPDHKRQSVSGPSPAARQTRNGTAVRHPRRPCSGPGAKKFPTEEDPRRADTITQGRQNLKVPSLPPAVIVLLLGSCFQSRETYLDAERAP